MSRLSLTVYHRLQPLSPNQISHPSHFFFFINASGVSLEKSTSCYSQAGGYLCGSVTIQKLLTLGREILIHDLSREKQLIPLVTMI